MKGFFLFLGIIALLIGSYIYYNIEHPSNTMVVRHGLQWVTLEHNMSK